MQPTGRLRIAVLVLVGLALLIDAAGAAAPTSGSHAESVEPPSATPAAQRPQPQQCQNLDSKVLTNRSSADIFRDTVGGAAAACATVRQDSPAVTVRTVLFARNPVDALVARLISDWKQKQGSVTLDAFAQAFLSAQPDNPMARFLLSTAADGEDGDTEAADGHLRSTDYLEARTTLPQFQHLVFQDTLQDSVEVLRFALDPRSSPRSHSAPSPPPAKQPARPSLRGMSRLANFDDLDLMQLVWRSHRAAIMSLLSFDMMLYQDMRLLAHQRASGALTRCRAAATRCPVTHSLVQLSIRLRP